MCNECIVESHDHPVPPPRPSGSTTEAPSPSPPLCPLQLPSPISLGSASCRLDFFFSPPARALRPIFFLSRIPPDSAWIAAANNSIVPLGVGVFPSGSFPRLLSFRPLHFPCLVSPCPPILPPLFLISSSPSRVAQDCSPSLLLSLPPGRPRCASIPSLRYPSPLLASHMPTRSHRLSSRLSYPPSPLISWRPCDSGGLA